MAVNIFYPTTTLTTDTQTIDTHNYYPTTTYYTQDDYERDIERIRIRIEGLELQRLERNQQKLVNIIEDIQKRAKEKEEIIQNIKEKRNNINNPIEFLEI